MQRTAAQIEIARPAEDVFAQLIRVPDWHRWHWDWPWTEVTVDGDGGPGTTFSSSLDLRVRDQGSDILGVIELAVDAGSIATGNSIDAVDPEGDSAPALSHTDTYHPQLAVIEELDDAARVVFSLPWDVVDVREIYALQATPTGCLLTCVEHRGDAFFRSRLPHLSLPGSRRRTLQVGLKRLDALLA
jgi:hypothetical protein